MRVLAALALLAAVARSGTEDSILKRHGVRPTKASIRAYLRSLRPDEAMQERARALVVLLGSEVPALRLDAVRQLRALRAAPIAELERALQHPDPEIARSAPGLLDHARGFRRPGIMYAAFHCVSAKKLTGLVNEVLGALPLATGRFVADAGIAALRATATPDDLPLLRAAIRVPGEASPAAVHALATVRGRACRNELRGLLANKDDDRIRAAAAWELASLRDRKCLETLAALLDSPRIEARLVAWRALRAISEKRFGYAPYDTVEARRAPADLWLTWVRRNGNSVRWKVPLELAAGVRGRLLVSTAGTKKVVELDADGTTVWETAAQNPWCCAGVSNGHRLIGEFDLKQVVEYDDAGKEIWRLQLPGKPCSLQRLPNGNTLVAISELKKVIEYRPDRTIAWEVTVPGTPFFAERQPRSLTVVSLHGAGRVIEITRAKQIRNLFTGLRGPYSCRPTPTGNYLVCLSGSGRVVELTPSGKEVWGVGGLGWPASGYRLEDGRTIIAHRGGLEEFSPTGARRFILKVESGSVFVSRY